MRGAGATDFGSSRVTLAEKSRYSQGETHFLGYQARIDFTVVVRELDRLDSLVSGLIAAGANDLTSVTFQTSRLKKLRADARRLAITAARAKAELYCEVAGVRAGAVVAIEDANPDSLSGRSEGHTLREAIPPDDPGEAGGAIDPGAIAVTAAVSVVYRIEPGGEE